MKNNLGFTYLFSKTNQYRPSLREDIFLSNTDVTDNALDNLYSEDAADFVGTGYTD
jgi:hypothetical protein